MSRNRQTAKSGRSTDPADYQRVPRAVAAMPKDFPNEFEIAPHSHERAQLIYATARVLGTPLITKDRMIHRFEERLPRKSMRLAVWD